MDLGLALASVADWGSLQRDTLGVIVDKLVDISDRVRAGAVCKWWFCVIHDPEMKYLKLGGPSSHQSQAAPMMLIPTDDNDGHQRGLYNVVQSTISRTRLHVPYNQRCSGSSHGWLIYSGEDLSLTLVNPFSGATIGLPPIIARPQHAIDRGDTGARHDYEIWKVVLSADPSSLAPDQDFDVLALYDWEMSQLAMIRAGRDSSWIYARERFGWEEDDYSIDHNACCFEDITCWHGRFFAVNHRRLVSVEPDEARSVIEIRPIVHRTISCEQSYVVGCGDALMWIERYYIQTGPEYCQGGEDYDIEAHADHGQHKTNYDAYHHDNASTGYFEIDGLVYGYLSDFHHLTECFKVYHLKDVGENNIEAVELEHLDGHAIFLGDNNAISVKACDFPGCKPDCIYYMDDWKEALFQPLGPIDIGVFSLKDKSTTPLPCIPRRSQWHLPHPIWILPQVKSVDTVSVVSPH